jgi:hypothetical protein
MRAKYNPDEPDSSETSEEVFWKINTYHDTNVYVDEVLPTHQELLDKHNRQKRAYRVGNIINIDPVSELDRVYFNDLENLFIP